MGGDELGDHFWNGAEKAASANLFPVAQARVLYFIRKAMEWRGPLSSFLGARSACAIRFSIGSQVAFSAFKL